LKEQIAEAKTVGADQVVATDDDTAIANLPSLDAVRGYGSAENSPEKLIAKVKREECMHRCRGAAERPEDPS